MSILTYEKNDHIVVITLNRPDSMNAINYDMTYEMAKAWTEYERDDDAWVAIFTGTGRAFCAGRDLKEGIVNGKLVPRFDEIPIKDPYWEDTFEKPAIVAVNGMALGGGFLLSLRADLRIAASDAVFQLSEVNLGLPIGIYPAEHWLLRENLPYVIVNDLLTGKRLSAQRAYEVGFVNQVVPGEQLMEAAMKMAKQFTAVPPLAPYYNLKMLRKLRRRQAVLPNDLKTEGETNFNYMLDSADSDEAIKAFLEKRKPVFKRV